jgi:aspartate aminotransferase-like enzyme
VVDLAVPYDRAVTADQVAEALERHPDIGLVSLVHAEAATSTTNPVAEIGAVVRARGALLMLSADPAVPLAAGGGALATGLLRVDHYGPAADPAVVDRTLAALSAALRR